MSEEKIVNNYYQTNIKTSRNEDSVYAMKYASQQMLIDKLQQENQQLRENNLSYQEEMCRSWEKVDKYKSVLDEIREYINTTEVSDDIAGILTLKECMYFDEILQILDKVKE